MFVIVFSLLIVFLCVSLQSLYDLQIMIRTIRDKQFGLLVSREQIAERVAVLAERISADYKGRNPILLVVLNGAFVFAADLVRAFDMECEVQFVRYASYEGMDTTGEVRQLIGLSTDVKDRDVVVVEDIVDTGTTLQGMLPLLREKGAKSVEIATLLMKPDKLRFPLEVKYCAMEIPNRFIVGYGLDYDGVGRNWPDIYVVRD